MNGQQSKIKVSSTSNWMEWMYVDRHFLIDRKYYEAIDMWKISMKICDDVAFLRRIDFHGVVLINNIN